MKFVSFCGLLLLASLCQAIEVGTQVPTFTLTDQFDQSASLTAETKLLLVASSRDAAGIVDEAIGKKDKGYLEQRNTLYVADVSQMPSLITSLLMVPSMRSANYRVLLDYESEVAPEHLKNDGEVLWLELEAGTVVARRTYTEASALERDLEQRSP